MPQPLRVLIVEDSELDAELLERNLSVNGYELQAVRVETPQAMQAALCRQRWDVVISDFVMPHFGGLEALQLLKESRMDIPFIIVSGKMGEETAVAAMRAGAHDYILKNNLARLAPAIKREIAEAENRRSRREADEELDQLRKSLEARVIALVADQRQKDQLLIQQSRLAAMGEMIRNIAHQWRNPLNNVALIIQNVQLELGYDTAAMMQLHRDIRLAMEVIGQMSQTINDFSDFFHEEKEKQRFSIVTAVNSAVTLTAPAIKSQEIRLEIETKSDVTAFGFKNEYAQALVNIISNARNACMERCAVNPCISITVTEENGRSVLYVRDNGGGISEDVLPKIFDPYFTTRGPDRGTGIGLYMAKVIIEQNMAGRLTARNVKGGAEFRIEV